MTKTATFVFGLFLFTIGTTYGQPGYFSVASEKRGKDFSFPIILNTTDTIATSKINQLLQISELELLKGYEKKDVFEKVSDDDGTIYGGKVSISYTIFNNTNKHISLKFNEASCGATCSYWVRYYNFNSGNGELFQLKDLFTESGFEAFNKLISKRRISEFKRELAKVDTSVSKGLLDIIGCYQNDKLYDFYIKGNMLYIDGENCFSKHQKFFGINTITKFSLNEFEKYLNSYGKAIFSITQDSIMNFHSKTLPQLFEGRIAGKEVLMVLNNTFNQETRAEYVYLKYGIGIFLEGELSNGKLELTEKDAEFNDVGYIYAQYDDEQIIGTWTNKDYSKKYEVILKRK